MRNVRPPGLKNLALAVSLTASLALFGAEKPADQSDAPAMTNESQQQCIRLMQDPFPDTIVEKVLTKKGISEGQIKEITQELDAAAAKIPDKFAQAYGNDEEPSATNDPLSDVYNDSTEELDNARLEVFRDVMKKYVSDVEVAMQMFKDINKQRNKEIKNCSSPESPKS